MAIHTLAELNEMPAPEFVAALAPLFEGEPHFLGRLADERPFATEEELWERARATARGMPRDEQVELLNAFPRIGADPATISSLAAVEQGYSQEPFDEDSWITDELAALNDAYEERFGFRFVVFVAGRPRTEILPLLERATSGDPDEELRRGLDDAILIASDRFGALRGPAPLEEAQREAIALEVSRHMVGEIDDDALIRAARRLVEEGIASPALLALSLERDDDASLAAPVGRLMSEIALSGWDAAQSGQLLALHAAASILGEVSQPIDGARRIVAATDHPRLRELIGRWEEASDQREAIDILIRREAQDLFEAGTA